MSSRPWWHLRESDDGEYTLGTPGEGKVLVVTRRDDQGHPLERTWVEADAVDQYDDTRWSDKPF